MPAPAPPRTPSGRRAAAALAVAVAIVVAPACGTPDAESTSSATDAATATASPTTGASAVTSVTWDDPDTTGCTFLCDASGLPECDVWKQDCPDGAKCTAWADDGGNWNAHKCVPVARDPAGPGEPCTVMESAVSGLDDCEEGSICWNVDHDTSQGTCYAFCRHYPEACGADPVGCCPAGYYCYPNAILPLCWQQCDPFVQDCEGSGEACYPGGNTFQCTPDVSGDAGAIGEPCEYINTCDPGTYCGDPATFPDCDPQAGGCCIPFCSLAAPACPAGTECTAWYTMDAPMGFEDLGACVIPP